MFKNWWLRITGKRHVIFLCIQVCLSLCVCVCVPYIPVFQGYALDSRNKASMEINELLKTPSIFYFPFCFLKLFYLTLTQPVPLPSFPRSIFSLRKKKDFNGISLFVALRIHFATLQFPNIHYWSKVQTTKFFTLETHSLLI